MPKYLNCIYLIMLSLITSGCAKTGLFIANIPASFNAAKTYQNIVYNQETAQTLDLYVPKSMNQSFPVLVFFYGGRWTDGSKEQYRFIADAFTKQGYLVAIPNYRKYPNVKSPAFTQDGASAIAWIHANIGQYRGDSENIFVAGHSSGAHIGALVCADPKYLKAHNLTPNIIKGFAGLSGPYDFVPKEDDLKDMFGPPERYSEMQAPNFIKGQQPPMLLIHGLEDEIVLLKNAQNLEAAIAKNGGEVKLKTYKELNHIETVGSLMWFWDGKSDIKEQMIKFFDQHRD